MVWRAPATLRPWSTHTQEERGTERRDVRERKVRVEVNDDNRQPGGGSAQTGPLFSCITTKFLSPRSPSSVRVAELQEDLFTLE